MTRDEATAQVVGLPGREGNFRVAGLFPTIHAVVGPNWRRAIPVVTTLSFFRPMVSTVGTL